MIVKDEVRQLATVERITNIRSIEGADAILQANVRAWSVVIRLDSFNEDDLVLYLEPDTALPLSDPRFEFLASRGRKDVDGEQYHILRSAKLRGVFSQGLVLPLSDFPEIANEPEGSDVTSLLGLGKWEQPPPVNSGDIAGAFLTDFARKTDSERIQNLAGEQVWKAIKSIEWDATEKVDGTSCTVLRDNNNQLRVMGRNWEIQQGPNLYWNVVNHPRYREMFEILEPGEVVQLEIMGPGIQGNKLKLSEIRPFVFDFSRDRVMLPRAEWPESVLAWAAPLLKIELPDSPEELIDMVDGIKSSTNPSVLAEGVVFHSRDGSELREIGGRNTFKVINNTWLAKAKG